MPKKPCMEQQRKVGAILLMAHRQKIHAEILDRYEHNGKREIHISFTGDNGYSDEGSMGVVVACDGTILGRGGASTNEDVKRIVHRLLRMQGE